MRLSHFFIDRPIFAGVLSLLITILGVFYLGLFPGRVISAFQSRPSITVKMR